MTQSFRSVFDIIGPIMVGPSSSHTAGALALGKAAAQLFEIKPSKVTIHYYESFADTHLGHGTDFAILGGILGFSASDPMIPQSLEMAKSQKIAVSFIEEKGESPVGHPNTATMTLEKGDKKLTVTGSSIGGGAIVINSVSMANFTMTLDAQLPLYFIRQNILHEHLFTEDDWQNYFSKKNYGLNDIRIFREKDIEWVILYLETYPSSDIIFEINAMPFVEKAILIH
jgi:L-serine dehydratase